jgi:VCBS repeat-containing protein
VGEVKCFAAKGSNGGVLLHISSGPANGTLSLQADGSFSYSPNANFHGADSFTYKAISNGQEMISSANIVIEPLNDAPAAANDEFTIAPPAPDGQPAAINNVMANDSDIDGDALAANLVSGPAHGTLTLNSDGTFNYAPQDGFTGDDAFRYQLFDGKANSNVATVTLHVEPGTAETPPPEQTPPPPEQTPPPPAENQRPLAVNDVFTTPSGATLDVPVASGLLTNDSDPEGGPITASLFSNPLHGNVLLAANGSFSYTPTSGYAGMDAFLYRVSDGTLWSPLAAVTIHVTPADGPDEAPIPTPAPAPQPDPEPQPCHPHHCCHVASHVLDAVAHGHHGGHDGGHLARAVDAVFGHRGWHA